MRTRILLLLALIAFSFTAHSEIDSLQYADTKELLKTLSINTGDAVKVGYDIVVGQQKVKAIINLSYGIAAIVSFWLFLHFYRKVTNNEMNVLIPAIIFLTIAIFSAIPFGTGFSQMVTGFVNPDYAAIEDIVKMARNATAGPVTTPK